MGSAWPLAQKPQWYDAVLQCKRHAQPEMGDCPRFPVWFVYWLLVRRRRARPDEASGRLNAEAEEGEEDSPK